MKLFEGGGSSGITCCFFLLLCLSRCLLQSRYHEKYLFEHIFNIQKNEKKAFLFFYFFIIYFFIIYFFIIFIFSLPFNTFKENEHASKKNIQEINQTQVDNWAGPEHEDGTHRSGDADGDFRRER